MNKRTSVAAGHLPLETPYAAASGVSGQDSGGSLALTHHHTNPRPIRPPRERKSEALPPPPYLLVSQRGPCTQSLEVQQAAPPSPPSTQPPVLPAALTDWPFLSLAANSSLLGGGGGEWTLPVVWGCEGGTGGGWQCSFQGRLSPADPAHCRPSRPQPSPSTPQCPPPPISPSLSFSLTHPLGLAWSAISVDTAGPHHWVTQAGPHPLNRGLLAYHWGLGGTCEV